MKVITSQNGKMFITVGANQIWDVAENCGVYSVGTQGCSFAQYKLMGSAYSALKSALNFIAYAKEADFRFDRDLEGETD